MSKEAKRVQEEKDRKKAEVRARLEAAAQAKKGGGKKGFMTPARKKKLRTLLRKKAAEELKKEQERKAEERKKTIAERCGPPKQLEGINEAGIQAICKQYHQRIMQLEDAKYDLEYAVRQKEFVVWAIITPRSAQCRMIVFRYPELMQICKELHERINHLESEKYDMEYQARHKEYKINELNIQVNDLRGKFIKPPLKKVSKFEYGKFDKLMRAAKKADQGFRGMLKSVEKPKFTIDEGVKEAKPDWALGAKKADAGGEAEE
ncbi:hypothetical protein JTE90_004223 [Oedothorax gibbosus]|uniref:Troponin I n=1 Tax=Oedothorax gibbosus TaxID=931172 RepID=A0AAV6UQ02_9ARAC|nr:hypothetical protein JTE90_004223 [Oedothorax gibbosus]